MNELQTLRNRRDEIVKRFSKNYQEATAETQQEMDELCCQIAGLMTDENTIAVTFLRYEDGKRVEKQGRVLMSDDEEHNRFFRFCIGYKRELDEFTPFYHIHDHFPGSPHRIRESLDILEGAYVNQFVDDFVYRTVNGELGIKYGNLQIDSWDKHFECCLTSSVHANPFSSTASLISVNHKQVKRYEGGAWYHTNRIIGEY